MGRLTTHVLDTARGRPGAGITVTLYTIDTAGSRTKITTATTNQDGRTDKPLLGEENFSPGVWELEFTVGDYFAHSGLAVAQPPFLDQVVLRFGIAETEQHYHVPLLVSPWSYSTYRGS